MWDVICYLKLVGILEIFRYVEVNKTRYEGMTQAFGRYYSRFLTYQQHAHYFGLPTHILYFSIFKHMYVTKLVGTLV